MLETHITPRARRKRQNANLRIMWFTLILLGALGYTLAAKASHQPRNMVQIDSRELKTLRIDLEHHRRLNMQFKGIDNVLNGHDAFPKPPRRKPNG